MIEPKPADETWFAFMDRAKRNGLSPTLQEEIDRQMETKQGSHNKDDLIVRP